MKGTNKTLSTFAGLVLAASFAGFAIADEAADTTEAVQAKTLEAAQEVAKDAPKSAIEAAPAEQAAQEPTEEQLQTLQPAAGEEATQ